jgi:hypothetical protein
VPRGLLPHATRDPRVQQHHVMPTAVRRPSVMLGSSLYVVNDATESYTVNVSATSINVAVSGQRD